MYGFAYFVTVVRHAVCQDFATLMHRFVCCIVFPQKRKLVVFCHSKGPRSRSEQPNPHRARLGTSFPGRGFLFQENAPGSPEQVPKQGSQEQVPKQGFQEVPKRFPHTHSLQKEAFRHKNLYGLFTRKLLHRSFCTEMPLQTEVFAQKFLLREAFKQSSFYRHRSFYTEKILHREAFSQTSVCGKEL